MKAKTSTAVKDHMFFCDHVVSLGDFKILASRNSKFHLEIKEILLIWLEKPNLIGMRSLCYLISLINVFLLEYVICAMS